MGVAIRAGTTGVVGLCLGILANTGCYRGLDSPPADTADPDRPDPMAEGGSDDGDGGSSTGDPGEDVDSDIAPTDLRRLTRYEYRNTIAAIFPEVSLSALDLLPFDEATGRFDTEAQELTEVHVHSYATAARLTAQAVVDDPAARADVIPCYGEGQGSACARTVVETIGPKLLRRPLTDADVESYVALYEETTVDGEWHAHVAVLSAMLQAPDFVFKLELGEEPDVEAEAFKLTADEVANRLAYYAWGAPPDDELREAAAAGRLDQTEDVAAALDRLLADDRARDHLRHYYRQWLALDRPMPARNVEDLPEWFTGETEVEGLTVAMDDEIYGLMDWLLWEERGGWREMMTTDLTYVTADSLAALYGVAPPPGDDPIATIPDGSRNGLLTRLHFSASQAGHSEPIFRGSWAARQLLCIDLPPPDPDAIDGQDPIELDPLASTREKTEAITAPLECQGCHAVINRLGFAMEDLDALGRFRDTEPIYDGDGALLAEPSIDAEVELMLDGASVTVNGAAELGAALAASDDVAGCAAGQWVRFASGQRPGNAEDELLGELVDVMDEAGLVDMIAAMGARPEFRMRGVQP